jgi:hypothetical protein
MFRVAMRFRKKALCRNLVNHNDSLPPGFFVSVDSKGLGAPVSSVESKLAGHVRSVDSRGFTGDIIGRVLWDEKRWKCEGEVNWAWETIMRNHILIVDYRQRE